MNYPELDSYTSVFAACTTVDICRASATAARGAKDPAPLWPPFWNEGEVCVLFSETNAGKSIVAMQIADDIARGCSSITGRRIRPRRVLYFDYELSDSQFRSRYRGSRLSSRLYRARPLLEGIETLDIDAAVADIVRAMEAGYKAIIIDNITFISSSIADSSHALLLMKTLKAESARHRCPLLLIAHTPKRQAGRPISKADIAGSSNILNFADSAFALGRSSLDSGLRYLKQIKVRQGEFVHDTDNVLVGRFDSPGGRLSFVPLAGQPEELHL